MKIDIGRVDKTQPHLFADTLEIWCAANGGPISLTDATSLIQSSVTPAEEALDLDDADEDDDGIIDNEPSVEITERNQSYAEECFRQLEYRQGAFGEAYPFRVVDERLELNSAYHPLQCLYLFLLYASRSRSFSEVRGLDQALADYFEEVGRDALIRLMPPSAEVAMFGPRTADRRRLFHSNLREALPRLAAFMGIEMAPSWKPAQEQAQGDGKIDLVGVQKLDDSEGGWNLFLAQCAAQEKHQTWQSKRIEADLEYHRGRFHSNGKAQAVLFVPGCFRQANGAWVDKNAAANVILMDRLRILRVVDAADSVVDGSCDFLQQRGLTRPAGDQRANVECNA